MTHHVHVIWLFAVYVCVFTSKNKQAKQVALYASMFGSAVPNTTEIRISDWTSTNFTSQNAVYFDTGSVLLGVVIGWVPALNRLEIFEMKMN